MQPEAEAPSLKAKITGDLKSALIAREKVRVSILRLLLAAIKNAEIARQATLSDGDILGIIAKEVRQHQESIDAFKQGDRADLVAQEEAEMAILQEYLPRQMTREEIVLEARRIITEIGAQGPGDKGKVMPRLIAQLKGKADGREINAVVTELLSS
ncbi:MAG TPA: GatB/YqeY domain-containing protein [Dehalococcoidia bacterium]|nr:GatB/YqeY domain-containing protein [Dehalococcoidia bacterium]